MQQHPVSLELACSALPELWSPRVVGQVGRTGQGFRSKAPYIKVARVQDEFPSHTHTAEDEMFLVLRGKLTVRRSVEDGGGVAVRAGEFFIVPRGVRHATEAATETRIALIEAVTTEPTGAERTPLTRCLAEQLGQG